MLMEEFPEHLRNHNYRDWLIVRMARETRWPLEEVSWIQVEDLRGSEVQRHDGSRALISEELIELSLSYRRQVTHPSRLLFLTRDGRPIHRSALNQTVRLLGRKLGYKVQMGDLLAEGFIERRLQQMNEPNAGGKL